MTANKYNFAIVGTDQTKKMFTSLRGGLRGVRAAVNSTQLQLSALAGVAGLGAVVNASRQSIDTMAKVSDRLNITTQDLAAYRHMTELNGQSAETFDKSLEKMVRSIGEASRGLGTGKVALEQMGIEVSDLVGLDAGKQFEVIAEGISKQADQTTKASLAADIFGRSGVAMLNTISQGAEGIAAARDEVDDYGLALTRVDAAKVEEANDQLFRVGQVSKGLGQKLTVALAPMISVVADKLIHAATSGDNMGKTVTRAIGYAVKGVGIFADGLRGLNIIFTGVKLAANSLGAVVLGIYSGIGKSISEYLHSVKVSFLTDLQSVLEFASRFSDTAKGYLAEVNAQLAAPVEVPGFVAMLKESSDSMAANAAELRGELQSLLMADLPSAVFQQQWDQIQAEAEQRAQETAAKIAEKLNTTPAGDTGGLQETDAEGEARLRKEEAERARIEARLLRLDEAYYTELEMLESKHRKELELIAQAEEAKVITENAANSRRLRADESFQKAKTGLAKTSEKAKLSIITGALGQLESLASGGSKKMFKVQKAAALAQAAVSLPAAVVDTFRNNGGYPWGLIPAALMAAQGLKQIASIKNQTFEGGGSTPAVSGGGGGGGMSTPQAQSVAASNIGSQFSEPETREAPRSMVNINITGDVIGDTAETLVTRIRTLIEDNDAILFSSNSRQALELGAT